MFERIVLPLDGSDLAEAAIEHAVAIAEGFDGEIVLLRVVPTLTQLISETVPREAMPTAPMVGDLGVEVASQQYEAQEDSAEIYLERISSSLTGRGRRVSIEVREGSPGPAIVEAAKALGAGLVVMSTHGRGGLGRLLNGSVADEVLRESSVPVLLIRPKQGGR